MEQTKALITSKTFAIALLQAALGAVVAFSSAYPEVGGLMIAKSVLDIVLRVYTTQPVGGIFRK